MTIIEDQVVFIEDIKLIRCEDVDLDEDLDYLVTGGCIQISDTVFYISEEILREHERR